MSLLVRLPHGQSLDLSDVNVIRSVDQKESDGYNDRIAADLGTHSQRRWTAAIEKPGESGKITTRYTSDITVAQLVSAAPALKDRFDLIDGGRAALAKDAKVHLIRPLGERADSDKHATIWVGGGSSNGLNVTKPMAAIKAELGAKAGGLTQIGDEGFIDRSRINRVSTFDPTKELAEGQAPQPTPMPSRLYMESLAGHPKTD